MAGTESMHGPYPQGRKWRLVFKADGPARYETFGSKSEAESAMHEYREERRRHGLRLMAAAADELSEDPAWVYFLLSDTGAVLYVGCTTDLVGRRSAHRKSGRQFSRMTYLQRMAHGHAVTLEATLIRELSPPWNTAHNGNIFGNALELAFPKAL